MKIIINSIWQKVGLLSKIYHLEGQKFGKLSVIERTVNPNSSKKKTFWKCVCECGNESVVATSSLVGGKTQQCWECAHYASNLHKRKDYTGQRFGKLVVLEMIYPNRENKQSETQVKCKCDCGQVIIRGIERLVRNIKNGYISSCGCRRQEYADEQRVDIIGKRYGRLIPVEYMPNISPVKVKCICDCGNETIVAKSDIMSGHTQSCGCWQKERVAQVNSVDYTGQVTDTAIKFIRRERQTRTGQWLWLCECQICSNMFIGCPSMLKSKGTVGCGRHEISSKESIIESYLKSSGVNYKAEYRFSDCKDQYSLPFDFALLSSNGNVRYLIEYDGKQHYQIIDYFGGEEAFKLRKYHDQIKNDYCKKNNIPLLRLPYYLNDDEIKEKISSII